MEEKCVAINCHNTLSQDPERLLFFVFPRDDNMRSKWLKGCKDNILLDKSSSRNLLCSDHFADDYFVDENGKKTIKTNAMPLPTKFTDQSMPNLDTSQQVPKEKEGSKSQFDKPQSMVLDLRIKRYPKRKLTTTFHHCRFCAFLYPKPLLMSPFKRNVTSVIKKLYPEKVWPSHRDNLPEYICKTCAGRLEDNEQMLGQMEVSMEKLQKSGKHSSPAKEPNNNHQVHDPRPCIVKKPKSANKTSPKHGKVKKKKKKSKKLSKRLKNLSKLLTKDTLYKVKMGKAALKSKMPKDSGLVGNRGEESDSKTELSASKKPLYEVFRCHCCKLFFLTKENVLAHFNKRHGPSDKPIPTYRYVSRQKPIQAKHKCHACLTWFLDAKSLERHNKKHHKEKSNKSDNVKGSISSPDAKSLKEREKTQQHDDQGDQIYRCSICNVDFSSKWSWKFHLSFHNDCAGQKMFFECDHCNKRFARKRHMRQHIQSHMDSEESNMSSEQLKVSFLERLRLVRQALAKT